MTEGSVSRSSRFFGVLLLVFALAASACARPSVPDADVTIISVTTRTIQVMGQDGQTETLSFGPVSAFLRRGLLVRAAEFLPGETATLRRHVGPGGAIQVGLLCDLDSAMALEKCRGRPVCGTLLSLSPQVWVVSPEGGAEAAPLSLLVSARTVFSVGGSTVAASAFQPGAVVTLTTRGLPSGLLSLVSAVSGVSEALPPAPRSAFVSGLTTEVQSSTLTLQDASGVLHTIAINGATRVKVRRQAASLVDIVLGMHVSAWLGSKADSAGNPIATTVSATGATHKTRKRSP